MQEDPIGLDGGIKKYLCLCWGGNVVDRSDPLGLYEDHKVLTEMTLDRNTIDLPFSPDDLSTEVQDVD